MSWNDTLDEFKSLDESMTKIEATAVGALSFEDAESVYGSITNILNRLQHLKARADDDIQLTPDERAFKRWTEIMNHDDVVITSVANKAGKTLRVIRSSDDASYTVTRTSGDEYSTEDL